ncbi:MAG: MATE family efflux transporter [Bacteroidetes bacterium]|nr:MATE family efflux transporter [Bacteroidota bacterium]
MNGYKTLFIEYLKLAPPILISIAVGFVGIAIADTIMVGQLGSEYLAAASLTNSLYGVFFIFSIGTGVAISPIISSAFGKKKFNEMNEVLKHSILLNLITGIILFLIMISFVWNVNYLKQSQQVLNLAKPYMFIIALSIFPNSLKDILKRYIEGIGLAKISMVASIITFFTNLILNYILINGKFGFPELKLIGAGLATLIARIVDTSIISIFIVIRLKSKGYLKNFNTIKFQKAIFLKLSRICFPSGFQLTFEMGFFGILNIMVGWLGIKYLAAHAIAMNISRITFVIPLSISIASSILIGKFKGKNDFRMVNKTGFLAYSIILCFYIFIFFIFFNSFDHILKIYKAEYQVEQIIKSFLHFFIIFQIADGINVVGVNLLRGMQDTLIPVVITSTIQWVFGLSAAYILSSYFNMNIKGIYLAAALTFCISGLSLFLRFRSNYKKINLK